MTNRSILLLQGVSSPFFDKLGTAIFKNGYPVHKINFCGGDVAFSSNLSCLNFKDKKPQFPHWFRQQLTTYKTTDIILFGDTREMNRLAIDTTKTYNSSINIHVYEEGYLRPNWLTLDKGGVNAYSRSFSTSPSWFREQAKQIPDYDDGKPSGYSLTVRAYHDMRYHLASFLQSFQFSHYTTHRPVSPLKEYGGWIKRYLTKQRYYQKRQTKKAVDELIASKKRYYVLPLQLASDAQIRLHSPFNTVEDVLHDVICSFAQRAPEKSVLVIKNHPFDTGIIDYQSLAQQLCEQYNCQDRLLYIESGNHLPALLPRAKGTVLVNSTVGMSALYHGSPLCVLGSAIYDIEGLTFKGSLDDFWTKNKKPDPNLYQALRKTIIHLTQINGDFYSKKGINMAVEASLKKLALTPKQQTDNTGLLDLKDGNPLSIRHLNSNTSILSSPNYLLRERS